MPWKLATLITFSFFFQANAQAGAGIYTWIDSQGVAHYSDYPPGKVPHKPLELPTPTTMPMAENLRQEESVSDIRDEVKSLISGSDRPYSAGGESRAAAQKKREQACDKYRRELDRIHARLRAGYSNDKGNSLRRQRRTVSGKLSRECILR